MLYASAAKEQFSLAYAHATATAAGLSIAAGLVDDDSIDITLARRQGGLRIRSPRLDLQLKCTARSILEEEVLTFRLKRKNYDDLRSTDFMVPRILVVMTVPQAVEDWLVHTELETRIHHGAWWLSLEGWPALRDDQASTVIQLPRSQVFNPSTLTALMDRVARGESLGR